MQQSNMNDLGKQMLNELISAGGDLRAYVKKQGIKLSQKYTLKFVDACNPNYPDTITHEVTGSKIGLAAERVLQAWEGIGKDTLDPKYDDLLFVYAWGRANFGYDWMDGEDPNVFQLAILAVTEKDRKARIMVEASLAYFMLHHCRNLAQSPSGTVVVTMTNPIATYAFYEALPKELTSGFSYTAMQHYMMQYQKLAVTFE